MEARHIDALRLIVSRLEGAQVNWALTGSMSFALQGVPVPVNDIDIQTDQAGAYALEQRLSEFVQRPVAFSGTERIRSHLGALAVCGVKVEIMGDIQKRLPDGSWEEPVDPARHREIIAADGMQVPVLSLEYEQEAYRKMGRTERANLLSEWLRQQER